MNNETKDPGRRKYIKWSDLTMIVRKKTSRIKKKNEEEYENVNVLEKILSLCYAIRHCSQGSKLFARSRSRTHPLPGTVRKETFPETLPWIYVPERPKFVFGYQFETMKKKVSFLHTVLLWGRLRRHEIEQCARNETTILRWGMWGKEKYIKKVK